MAVSAVAVKAAIAIAQDEKARTLVLSIIVGVFAFFFIILGTLFTMQKGSSESNQQALSHIFNTVEINLDDWEMPDEYRIELAKTKARISSVRASVNTINALIESEEKIDDLKAGVIYLCLFPNGETTKYNDFAWCFAEKLIIIIVEEDGEETTKETAIAISDTSTIYNNIQNKFGISVTSEQIQNIEKTYNFLISGGIFMGSDEDYGIPSIAYTDDKFKQLMDEATKYIGFPYVWGGSNPKTSFDCSGFVCWSYTASGVRNLPRTTAQGIYNQCTLVSESEVRPGDLVFFTGTYKTTDTITHIGIYVGDGNMLHCGNPIKYAGVKSAYWAKFFYAYGRLT